MDWAERFVTKIEWGASPKTATPESHPIGATEGVTLHWEGPHMGPFDHSKCVAKVRGIEDFHEDTRGWADIAYNALVCPHGYVFEGRGVNTKSAANGNETANGSHYAVCYLGGEGDGFTADGKEGMIAAVQWLRREGSAGPEVNGHRDHKSTECPGNEIYSWLQNANFNEVEESDDVDEVTLRRVIKEEVAAFFRDEDGGLPDIGRARVVSRDGTEVLTLADLLFGILRKTD